MIRFSMVSFLLSAAKHKGGRINKTDNASLKIVLMLRKMYDHHTPAQCSVDYNPSLRLTEN